MVVYLVLVGRTQLTPTDLLLQLQTCSSNAAIHAAVLLTQALCSRNLSAQVLEQLAPARKLMRSVQLNLQSYFNHFAPTMQADTTFATDLLIFGHVVPNLQISLRAVLGCPKGSNTPTWYLMLLKLPDW